MKNLARILLVAGALSLPFIFSKAQQKDAEKNPQKELSLFLGYDEFSDEYLSENYGGFWKLGAGFSSEVIKDELRVGGNIGIMSKKIGMNSQEYQQGDLYRIDISQENNFSALEISARADYIIPDESSTYYIGLGAVMINATEKAEGTARIFEKTVNSLMNNYTYYKQTETRNLRNTESSSRFGAELFAGWETSLSGSMKFFIEADVRTVPDNLGGMSLKAGIKNRI
jgi:opacity protein-like surface antigen